VLSYATPITLCWRELLLLNENDQNVLSYLRMYKDQWFGGAEYVGRNRRKSRNGSLRRKNLVFDPKSSPKEVIVRSRAYGCSSPSFRGDSPRAEKRIAAVRLGILTLNPITLTLRSLPDFRRLWLGNNINAAEDGWRHVLKQGCDCTRWPSGPLQFGPTWKAIPGRQHPTVVSPVSPVLPYASLHLALRLPSDCRHFRRGAQFIARGSVPLLRPCLQVSIALEL